MNYEVRFGEKYQIVNAGNPMQACIYLLQDIKDNEKIYRDFQVNEITSGKEWTISLKSIMDVLLQSQQCVEGDMKYEKVA
jgi:hypothetical protein